MSPNKCIFFVQDEGLCNRIKKIVMILRSMDEAEDSIYLIWNTGKLVPNKFYEYFQKIDGKVSLIELENNQFGENVIDLGKDCDWVFRREKTYRPDKVTNLRAENIKSPNHINFAYNTIEPDVCDDYLRYFSLFKPSKLVEERMKDIVECSYFSVHVRNNAQWRADNRIVELNKYYDAIDSLDKTKPFYLAYCDESVLEAFKDKYGERVLYLKNKRINDGIDTAADLFLLSKGDLLIASYGSTFSEVSWWLSGAKNKVIEVGEEKKKKDRGMLATLKYTLYRIKYHGIVNVYRDLKYQIKRQNRR